MIEIKRSVIQKSARPTRVTQVRLSNSYAEFRLEIAESFNARQRRTVINSLLRHMRPWLEFFKSGSVTHRGATSLNFKREAERMEPWFSGKKEGLSIQKQALGLRIRLKRLEIGLTQQQLAEKAGISRMQLIQIESGRSQPRSITLHRISKTLNLT